MNRWMFRVLSMAVISISLHAQAVPDVVVGTLAKKAAYNGDGLRLDAKGNVFVGTSRGHQIYKVTPSGEVSLFASLPTGSANGSCFDSKGNLFVANESAGIIHKITPEGAVSEYLTQLDGPAGLYFDASDNLYVSLFGHGAPAATVLKVTPDKTVSTFASGGGLTNVVGIAGDGAGRFFAANFMTGEIFEITGGTVKEIGKSGTRVNHLVYRQGYLYTPNPFDQVVRRMDLKGTFEILAGTRSSVGSTNGAPSEATFSRPNSIDISADGKTIYVLDFNTGDVRTLTSSQGF